MVEVVGVCWRHTTMSDGNLVCFPWASGVNVWTLGGARGGAPHPWGIVFCKRWSSEGYRTIGCSTRCVCEVDFAEALWGIEFK
jgi:hypothetical protein